MKKKIIIAVLFGVIFSVILYLNYKNNSSKNTSFTDVYFLQFGAYQKYENVSIATKLIPSYLVIKEDNLYHIYVGITKNKENADKIKEFYNKNGNNIYVSSKNIEEKEFIKKLESYDYLLKEAKSEEVINAINKEILNIYEEYYKNENKANAGI